MPCSESGLCAEGGVEYWKVFSRDTAGSDLCSGSRTLRTAWLVCGILQPSFLFGFGMTWREDELGTSLLLIQTCRKHAQVTGRADGTVRAALSMFSDAFFLGIPHSTTLSSEDRVG